MNSIERQILRMGTAVLVGAALNFGIDQGPTFANAETSTPTATSTSTRTPTPDLLATQIAEAKKDLAGVQAQRELANIRKQIEVLTTPQVLATPGPKINEVVVAIETVVAGRLGEKTAATARAEVKFTSTPVPPTPRLMPEFRSREPEGPIWEKASWEVIKGQVIIGLTILSLAFMGLSTRNAIFRLAIGFGGFVGAGVRRIPFIGGRFGGGGIGTGTPPVTP